MKPDPNHYINRELSWLEFNQRVLNQAQYAQVPVLERLKRSDEHTSELQSRS